MNCVFRKKLYEMKHMIINRSGLLITVGKLIIIFKIKTNVATLELNFLVKKKKPRIKIQR